MRALHRLLLSMAALTTVIGCSLTGSTPAATGTTAAAPIGRWAVTITEDDFRQAGLADQAGIEENAGTFTFTVKEDGTYTEVQEAERPIKWPVFRGTWSADGPSLLGLRTVFPADYEGEFIAIEWALEDGNLRLRLVSPLDPALKVHFETHPWTPAP